jgi:transketolase
LGASHHCAEDLACLRPLPDLRIYSPCDVDELAPCFREAQAWQGPSYIRIGKSDRPRVHAGQPLLTTEPHFTYQPDGGPGRAALVACGSMVALATALARKLGISAVSVPRLKPFPGELTRMLAGFLQALVLEEHSRYGGLFSSLAELLAEHDGPKPLLKSIALEDKFADRCGSYQYALSEHQMSDPQIEERITRHLREKNLI